MDRRGFFGRICGGLASLPLLGSMGKGQEVVPGILRASIGRLEPMTLLESGPRPLLLGQFVEAPLIKLGEIGPLPHDDISDCDCLASLPADPFDNFVVIISAGL